MPAMQTIVDLLLRPEVALPVLLAGLLIAFWVGRRTSDTSVRVRELEGALGDAGAERERLAAELADARTERAQLMAELADYRKRVADHFVQTSQKLHDLTLQYRAVYDHLAAGAGELCPDSLEKLEGGLGLDALPEETGKATDRGAPEDREPQAGSASGSPDLST